MEITSRGFGEKPNTLTPILLGQGEKNNSPFMGEALGMGQRDRAPFENKGITTRVPKGKQAGQL